MLKKSQLHKNKQTKVRTRKSLQKKKIKKVEDKIEEIEERKKNNKITSRQQK